MECNGMELYVILILSVIMYCYVMQCHLMLCCVSLSEVMIVKKVKKITKRILIRSHLIWSQSWNSWRIAPMEPQQPVQPVQCNRATFHHLLPKGQCLGKGRLVPARCHHLMALNPPHASEGTWNLRKSGRIGIAWKINMQKLFDMDKVHQFGRWRLSCMVPRI